MYVLFCNDLSNFTTYFYVFVHATAGRDDTNVTKYWCAARRLLVVVFIRKGIVLCVEVTSCEVCPCSFMTVSGR